jgi:hypothetical protein
VGNYPGRGLKEPRLAPRVTEDRSASGEVFFEKVLFTEVFLGYRRSAPKFVWRVGSSCPYVNKVI